MWADAQRPAAGKKLGEFSAALLVFSVGVLDKHQNVISEGGSGLVSILAVYVCISRRF